jgi:hypothetical protein
MEWQGTLSAGSVTESQGGGLWPLPPLRMAHAFLLRRAHQNGAWE